MSRSNLQLRLTGKTGEVDGYAEIMLGMFGLSGILRGHKLSKRTRPHGITQIYIDMDLAEPPLGHLGESDIPHRGTK